LPVGSPCSSTSSCASALHRSGRAVLLGACVSLVVCMQQLPAIAAHGVACALPGLHCVS
jgi:hypothetical protein